MPSNWQLAKAYPSGTNVSTSYTYLITDNISVVGLRSINIGIGIKLEHNCS